MQLSGIIAFLLLSQYEVSSRHNGRFAQELELFQNSLVERIYEDTSLDPEQDNDEIEEIANAILDEAERRLNKRELEKHRYNVKKSADDSFRNEHSENHRGNPKGYKDVVDNAYANVVKLYDANKRKERSRNENKREVEDDDEIDQGNKEYKKQLNKRTKTFNLNTKSKRNDISQQSNDVSQQSNDVHNDQVEVSRGDNDQVATIHVDNTPDQQTRLANNPQVGSKLFLEPDTNDSKKKNISTYAAHRSNKSPPPQRVVTNRVDRGDLDEFSSIAIIVGCCVAGVAGIGLVSFCWYKLRTETKDSKNGSPNFKPSSLRGSDKKKTSDEEKLARGAEVFHYLHAKKQMQQMEEPNLKSDHCSINESSDDEEDDEDTVYECPGLAPPGDMKVVNPLFSDTESHYSDPPSLHSTPTPPSEEK